MEKEKTLTWFSYCQAGVRLSPILRKLKQRKRKLKISTCRKGSLLRAAPPVSVWFLDPGSCAFSYAQLDGSPSNSESSSHLHDLKIMQASDFLLFFFNIFNSLLKLPQPPWVVWPSCSSYPIRYQLCFY